MNKNAAADKYSMPTEQVKAFQESLWSAEIRFNQGVINFIEYLRRRNNFDRAKINLMNASYD